MKKTIGNITIPADYDIWPHELKTAKALAAAGHDVTFVRRINGDRVKTPDIQMDGILWEMKCSETGQVKSLQRVLGRASTQSGNILIDSARMKGTSDQAVEHELRRLKPLVKAVRRLVLVNAMSWILARVLGQQSRREADTLRKHLPRRPLFIRPHGTHRTFRGRHSYDLGQYGQVNKAQLSNT